MPQAILPDLNSAYIRYRNLILEKASAKDYTMCFGALYAINAILPKEYQVAVSTIEYKKRTNTGMFVICGYCTTQTKDEKTKEIKEIPTEHDYHNIKVYSKMLDSVSRVIKGKDYEKLWDCPKCKKPNNLEKTEIIKTALQEPMHFQVVPNAPARKDGIEQRSNYDIDVQKWILQFLGELEYQMGRHRREYVPKSTETLDGGFLQTEENPEDYQ